MRRFPTTPWWTFLPEGVLGAGLLVFLIDEPDAATSALRSGRAVALMLVTGVVWLAARVVAARSGRWTVVTTGLFGAAALGVLAVVVLPAYDDETVVEAFPTAPATVPQEPVDAPLAATEPATASSPPAETVVEQAAPAEGAPATTATSATTAPAGPVRLRAASFAGIDHRAAGAVVVYRAPEGRLVVGLEGIDIQPGPDYDVYVVPGADRRDRDGGVRLDDLRGNLGTQYYDVPAGVDVTVGAWTVLVWCETFGVPVANATPA